MLSKQIICALCQRFIWWCYALEINSIFYYFLFFVIHFRYVTQFQFRVFVFTSSSSSFFLSLINGCSSTWLLLHTWILRVFFLFLFAIQFTKVIWIRMNRLDPEIQTTVREQKEIKNKYILHINWNIYAKRCAKEGRAQKMYGWLWLFSDKKMTAMKIQKKKKTTHAHIHTQ